MKEGLKKYGSSSHGLVIYEDEKGKEMIEILKPPRRNYPPIDFDNLFHSTFEGKIVKE